MKKFFLPRINTLVIAGRLTREPEIRYGYNNMMIAKVSLAFDRAKKDEYGNYQNVAHFIDVSCFGKVAEAVNENCHKGTPVLVEGGINTGSYTDQTGVTRKTVDILAEKVMLLERDVPDDQTQKQYPPKNQQSGSGQQSDPRQSSGQTEEDVPF